MTASSSQTRTAIVAESTWGTTPASPQLVELPVVSHSIKPGKLIARGETIRPDRQIQNLRHGAQTVAGEIKAELNATDYDVLLEAAFMSTFATNVLRIGTTRKSFTLEDAVLDKTQFFVYTGMMVDSYTLRCRPNEIAEATFGVVGKGYSQSTSALDATVTAGSGDAPFILNQATIQEGGSAIATITGLEFTLKNSVEPLYVIGATSAGQVQVGRAVLTGKLNALFDDVTLFNKFKNETESSIILGLTDGTHTHTYKITRLKYTDFNFPLGGGEADRFVEMSFEGLVASPETTLQLTKS